MKTKRAVLWLSLLVIPLTDQFIYPKTQSSLITSAVTYDSSGKADKFTYSYDTQGRNTVKLHQKWVGESWVAEERTTTEYQTESDNSVSKVLEELYSNGSWVNASLTDFSYSAKVMQSTVHSKWVSGAWAQDMKTEYSYNTDGRLFKVENDTMDAGQWIGRSIYNYTYDTSGRLAQTLYMVYIGGVWTDMFRTSLQYDANSYVSQSVTELSQSGQFENASMTLYTNDAQGHVLHRITKAWEGSDWMETSENTMTYSGGGELLTELDELVLGPMRLQNYLRSLSYDVNGKLETLLTDYYSIMGEIQYSTKISYTNDASGNCTLIISQIRNAGADWTDKDVMLSLPEPNSVAYGFYAHRVELNYEATGVAVRLNLPKEFLLMQNYPNPFNPSTTLSYFLPSQGRVVLRLYDILGREISTFNQGIQLPGWHRFEFNALNLGSGIYLYTVTAGNSTLTKAMIFLK